VTPVEYSDPTTAASDLSFTGVSFVITPIDAAGNPISGPLSEAMVITLTGVSDVQSAVVYFYDTNTSQWIEANSTCSDTCQCPPTVVDVANQTITTAVCHLTQFALFQAVAPSSTSGSSSSTSSNTTLIIEIVVPVGAVVIIAIIILVAVLRSKRSGNTSPSANSIEMGARSKPKTQTSPPTQSTINNNFNNSDTLKH
jgi:hypothetical protein